MTASHVSRIGGGALAGAAVGVLLHFVFGISLFSAPPRRSPASEAPVKAPPGVLEKERLASAHQKRVDDLAGKIAAAEQECADLKARIAATPAKTAETARDAKNRRFGGMIAKLAKSGAMNGRGGNGTIEATPENAAEMQRMMGELLSLAVELGIDLQDQTSIFRKPELLAGLYEGVLTECGVALDAAAVQDLRSMIAGRVAAAPQPLPRMAGVALGLQIQEEFLEKFGLRLVEKDPSVAALLGNFGGSNTMSIPETTVSLAATSFLKDVSKVAKLDDAQAAAVRPAFDSWASQYAAVLAEARTRYGDKVVDGVRGIAPVGTTAEEQYTHLRNRVRLQSQILQLQVRTLETAAQQLGGEAAERIAKFERTYYIGRFSP